MSGSSSSSSAGFDPTRWRGRPVTVMGLGSFGGGVGATRFFVDLGARVTVTDKASSDDLGESLEKLRDLPVRLALGAHDRRDFIETDLVVVNPAVPDDVPELAIAREHNVALTSEMNLFFQLCPAPIIGVTGSAGKSTTTALTAHILEATGRTTWLGGNIGRSLLPEWKRIAEGDHVVIELSSFQLEGLAGIGRSPHVAVVTNVSPNHLDRHGTMENYVSAKEQIVRDQVPGDVAVLHYDDEIARGFADRTRANVLFFSPTEPPECGVGWTGGLARFSDGENCFEVSLAGSRLIGSHNVDNMLAAVCVTGALGVGPETIAQALETFEPLPHRLQLVGEVNGVRYYNDSIATTPVSTVCALEAFDCPIVLIAGGYDKGIAFDSLAEAIVTKRPALRKLILIGQTARTIAEEVAKRTDRAEELVVSAGDLAEAVRLAHREAAPGDVVLLSPACASYDQFRNFVQRGDRFTTLSAELS